ncbi:MAG: hypothetical protein ACRYFW_12190 [Janthinobacterium lividum]
MIRCAVLASLVLTIAGCEPTARAPDPPRDNPAAQVADERAAEDKVTAQATLARLSRDVDELHKEVDQIKAGKQALNEELIDQRLRALEVAAQAQAQTPDAPPAPVPTTSPVAPVVAAKPKGHPASIPVPSKSKSPRQTKDTPALKTAFRVRAPDEKESGRD